MRAILIGAVESTRAALEAFAEASLPPIALVTLPLAHQGRHSDLVDLRPLARDCRVPVIEASDVNDPSLVQQLRELQPDYLFVIGWSQLFRQGMLNLPRIGCIGYHPSPLPKNRGRAVIPWTILQGAEESGSTFFWLDAGVDSGDVLSQEIFPLTLAENSRSLYDKHLASIKRQLRSVLPQLAAGNAPRTPQDHSAASYCARRIADDGLIDWAAPAKSVWALIRASGEPYPGAFTFRRGSEMRIWEADFVGEAPYCGVTGQIQALGEEGAIVRCGDGMHLRIRSVQLAGSGRTSAASVLRNHERLGMDTLASFRASVSTRTP